MGVTNEEKLKFGIHARNYVGKRLVCAKISFENKSTVINNWSIKSIISQWREEGKREISYYWESFCSVKFICDSFPTHYETFGEMFSPLLDLTSINHKTRFPLITKKKKKKF